jgi:hypothetical protein
MSFDLTAMLFAGFIGFFVGLSELVNRYTSFRYVFVNIYSWMYMLINLGAAMLVYFIIIKYNINIGEIGKHQVGLDIFAGIGAMAFLRSSFFNYRTSTGQIISVGPAAILLVFLRAAEMEFDRILSKNNVQEVSKIMKGITFISASKDLPLIILGSMRALSSDEQKTLSDDILKLVNDTTSTTEAKNIAMGTILIKYTGLSLLEASVKSLREIYDTKVKSDLDIISTLQEKLNTLK